MKRSRKDFLKSVSAFEDVSEKGLALISDICRPVAMKSGDVIIKEGEEGDCVYIIEEGEVEISMAITLASEVVEEAAPMDKILVNLGPGSMFGEMAFIFENDVRSATITARTDGSLLSIASADFEGLAQVDLETAHKIVLNIARTIAKRLRKTNEDVKKLTTVLSIAMHRPRK